MCTRKLSKVRKIWKSLLCMLANVISFAFICLQLLFKECLFLEQFTINFIIL